MNSGCAGVAGTGGGAVTFEAHPVASIRHATTHNTRAPSDVEARTHLRLFDMRLPIGNSRRQPLDESPRHVGFNHHPSVRGHVTDNPRHPVHARDLLPVELLGVV